MPTTSDYLTQLQQDREDLIDNLEEKGITGLTGNETFTELVPEVLNIETGGGSFQPRLPSEYQEVEYIQGTGTQYINTQYKPNQTTKTEVSVETINLNTTFVPFGTRANAQLDYVLGINFNSQNYIQYNTNTPIYSTQSSTPLLNTKFVASLSKEEGKITYIDTSTETTVSIVMTPTATSSFTCTTNLYLGCLNNNGNTQYLSPSYKIYYCKIWENGTLIKNLVPCYRKTDNEIGLYDLVNDSFFTNAGTGTFIKGNNHDRPLLNLQSKTMTITENTTTNITADSGYDGLDSVSVTTNVPSGGDVPEKGVVFSEWDSNGYPTKAQVVGLTSIPMYYFGSSGTEFFAKNIVTVNLPSNITSIGYGAFYNCKLLKNINLSNALTSIDSYAFYECTELELSAIPETVIITGNNTGTHANIFLGCTKITISKVPDNWTMIPNSTFISCRSITNMDLSTTNVAIIGTNAFNACSGLITLNLGNTQRIYQAGFQNCSSLTSVIANNVTILNSQSFYGCRALKKICLPSVIEMNATSVNYGQFYNCTSLKQVWIGSGITSANFGRFVFANCSALEKIYINLPRTTVEAFTNYQYAFMNDTTKTGIIVCNDDEDFITQQEFDELVIE